MENYCLTDSVRRCVIEFIISSTISNERSALELATVVFIIPCYWNFSPDKLLSHGGSLIFSVRAIIFWLKRIKFYWNLVTFRQTGIIWHFSPYKLLCQWYSGSVILFGWSNYLLIKEIPKSYWNLKSNWVRLTGIISLIECFCGMVITLKKFSILQ